MMFITNQSIFQKLSNLSFVKAISVIFNLETELLSSRLQFTSSSQAEANSQSKVFVEKQRVKGKFLFLMCSRWFSKWSTRFNCEW